MFNKVAVRYKNIELLTEKVMVNMTSQNLDDATINVLKKGFNFAIAQRRIHTVDIIRGVVGAIRHLPVVTAESRM